MTLLPSGLDAGRLTGPSLITTSTRCGAKAPVMGTFAPPPAFANRLGWPLISTAPQYHPTGNRRTNHRRGRIKSPRRSEGYENIPVFPPTTNLSRLAVHMRGAPLIQSASANPSANGAGKRNYNNNRRFTGKVNPKPTNKPVGASQQCSSSSDCLSVTSEESVTGSPETPLPRIIKPRKRRKKERKSNVSEPNPPEIHRDSSSDGSVVVIVADGEATKAPFDPLISRPHPHPYPPARLCECPLCEVGSSADVLHLDLPPVILTPPPSHVISSESHDVDVFLVNSLLDSLLNEPVDDVGDSSSDYHPVSNLEVSTHIVTSSFNGHRDLEIRFFTSRNKERDQNNNNSGISTCECQERDVSIGSGTDGDRNRYSF